MQTKPRRAFAAVAVIVILAAVRTSAHHGQAAYDMSKSVTVTGTVTEFQFVNPHCILVFDVKDDDKGVVERWQGELTSPNRLLRAGWTAQAVKPGDRITLTGSRAKSGAPSLYITRAVVNGREFKTAPSH
jgi:uncharacterized protein DUF6152